MKKSNKQNIALREDATHFSDTVDDEFSKDNKQRGVDIETVAQAIAMLVGIPAIEACDELNRQIRALAYSNGACERLFNKKMREYDWRMFSEAIDRVL